MRLDAGNANLRRACLGLAHGGVASAVLLTLAIGSRRMSWVPGSFEVFAGNMKALDSFDGKRRRGLATAYTVG
jgi:hypothetical protein